MGVLKGNVMEGTCMLKLSLLFDGRVTSNIFHQMEFHQFGCRANKKVTLHILACVKWLLSWRLSPVEVDTNCLILMSLWFVTDDPLQMSGMTLWEVFNL